MAIAEARKINKNYNTIQLSTIYKKGVDEWSIIDVEKWIEKRKQWKGEVSK